MTAVVEWTAYWVIAFAIVIALAAASAISLVIYVAWCATTNRWPWDVRARRKADERQHQRAHEERMAKYYNESLRSDEG